MKKIFKFLTGVISVTILLSTIYIFNVSAAANTIISFSKNKASVNDSLTVNITVTGSDKMYSTEFTVNYNKDVLKFVSGTSASGGEGSVTVAGLPSGATKQTYTFQFVAIASGVSQISASGTAYYENTEDAIGASASLSVSDVTQSANADLKSLSLSSGSLSPRFSASKTSYSATVPFSVTQCKIYATPSDAAATVVVSGNAKLDVGQTTKTVTVTAPNGAQKVYTIVITRQEEGAESVTSSDETVPEQNPLEAVVADVPYTVLTDIAGITLPKGFSAATADYNGNQVAIAVDNKSEFRIYYLKANDSDTVAPYLYNDDTKTFKKLDCFTFGNNIYIAADIPAELSVGKDYYSTNTEIGGLNVKCYATNDSNFYNFYYIYCYYDGNYNMYSYDSDEDMFQRAPEFKLVSSVQNEENKNSGIVERFNSLAVNAKIIVICLLIGIIGAIALIVFLIIKIMNRKNENDFEDTDMIFEEKFNNISTMEPFSMNSDSGDISNAENTEINDSANGNEKSEDNND